MNDRANEDYVKMKESLERMERILNQKEAEEKNTRYMLGDIEQVLEES